MTKSYKPTPNSPAVTDVVAFEVPKPLAMPTASEVHKLLGLFSPFLSPADSAKLEATVAALDWTLRQPLPQRRFGITACAPGADGSREQLQQRFAAILPQPKPQILRRETIAVTPSVLWSRFLAEGTFAGFLEVRPDSSQFSWSRNGGRKVGWCDSQGHRLALAAATAADTDSCYLALLRWMELNLAEAVWGRSELPLTVAERESVRQQIAISTAVG